MAASTMWWLAAGAAIAVELVTGTFYLLMVAIGLGAAAVAAHAGVAVSTQLVVAAVVGGGAVVGWHVRQSKRPPAPLAGANRDVNLDIGETVHITGWNADGTASVFYRGANWTCLHHGGAVPSTGLHKVIEVVGSRLLVEKI